MLVFSRKSHESLIIGGPADLERILEVTVLEVSDGKVKFGIAVVEGDHVHGWELWQRVGADGWPKSQTGRRRVTGALRCVERTAASVSKVAS
jgi:sRNA-binding carbon storage regulator CsrA